MKVSSDNILRVFDSATPDEYHSGSWWYANAREECRQLGFLFHLSIDTVAGIVAALSPGSRWHMNLRDAERVCAAGDEMPSVTTYGQNLAKAIAIRDGAKPLSILGGNKVICFYDCIVNSKSSCVAVDRHAIRVAAGGGYTVEEGSRWLSRKGNYERAALSYMVAADQAGIEPHQMQAITWLTYRRINSIIMRQGDR